jgi:SAM-dependent methyltransferase
MIIKSYSYDQDEIIRAILSLYAPSGTIDCDPTYSKGNFYKHIPKPKYRFDIIPSKEATFGDSRNLPLDNDSIECLMFDPPFLATTGKSLCENGSGNIINKRFGVYPSEKQLHAFYVDSIKEAHRILKDGGIFIFKCQDKVSGGKQYFSHCFIKQHAEQAGFYAKDLFILLSKNRIVANWQAENQKHSRKYHSYFWVFEKTEKQVNYL